MAAMADSTNRNLINMTIGKIQAKQNAFASDGDELREEIVLFAKTVEKLPVSDAAKVAAMESMLGTMRESLTTKHQIDGFCDAMTKVKEDASSGDFDGKVGEAFLSALQSGLERRMNEFGEADPENETQHAKLKKIARPILGGDEDEDDDEDVCVDDMQEASEASLKCPLSQGLLVKPMKSTKCGHTYSGDVAKNYFNVEKKCAVFGCNHKLVWKDFKKDVAKEVALRNFKKQSARNTQRQSTEDVDMSDSD